MRLLWEYVHGAGSLDAADMSVTQCKLNGIVTDAAKRDNIGEKIKLVIGGITYPMDSMPVLEPAFAHPNINVSTSSGAKVKFNVTEHPTRGEKMNLVPSWNCAEPLRIVVGGNQTAPGKLNAITATEASLYPNTSSISHPTIRFR